MAISYQNTSVSAASAAAAAATVQAAWRDALVGHSSAAWTIEDEFDSSGATVHWVVLKCATAASGVGFDFRVIIGRNTSTGALCVLVAENYVIGTKTISVFAPWTQTSGNNIIADGSFAANGTVTATYVLGTTLPGNPSLGPIGPSITQAATERWVAFVEKDYALLGVNGTFMYVGALTDLIVPISGLVAATPVGCFDLFNTTPGPFGALTRHPIAAADAPYNTHFPHAIAPISAPLFTMLSSGNPQAVLSATYGYKDRFQNNRVSASEINALMYAPFTSLPQANTRADKLGALRGKFKNIRWTTIPTAAAVYDTVVVDGKKAMIASVVASLTNNSASQPFATPTPTLAKPAFVFDTGAP